LVFDTFLIPLQLFSSDIVSLPCFPSSSFHFEGVWNLERGRQTDPLSLPGLFLQWLPRVFRSKFKLINSAQQALIFRACALEPPALEFCCLPPPIAESDYEGVWWVPGMTMCNKHLSDFQKVLVMMRD
jgi:hypothetical protein